MHRYAALQPPVAPTLHDRNGYGVEHLVREQHVVPLPEAIRKMTSLAARQLKIADRGTLKEGNFADVVIFDPNTVADTATYEKPHQYPVGINTVIVNGTVTVRGGQHTGAHAGRALYGPGYRRPS